MAKPTPLKVTWLIRFTALSGSVIRKWATERKHLPDVDVAAAGGWTETSSLKRCYQRADEATMLEVVLGGGQLREGVKSRVVCKSI